MDVFYLVDYLFMISSGFLAQMVKIDFFIIERKM